MEEDQLIKQVEWLDKERREDKKAIAALQKKVTELENLLEKSTSAIKDTNSELTRLGVIVTKIDQFEATIAEHRSGVKKELEQHETRAKKREETANKTTAKEVDKLRAKLTELELVTEQFSKIKQQFEEAKESNSQRDQNLNDLEQQFKDTQSKLELNVSAVKLIQEDAASNQKRMTDLVGEIAALRTKSDEMRGKHELLTENTRKNETRILEMAATDEKRRANQAEFLENLSRENENRDKTWKKWEQRFADVEAQSEAINRSLESYSEAERAVQKAQKDLDRITEQINRRIHEITEMQRLGEERFRQDWNTFRADDQKRWANYALTQEEQNKETSRKFERLSDRTTDLEELTQDLRDTVQHTGEQFEKLMQGVLASMRDWLATTERYTDSIR